MRKPLVEQIRIAINEAKIFRGLKKKDIAKALGISPTHLSNLLRGRNQWTADQMDRLGKVGIVVSAEDIKLARIADSVNYCPDNNPDHISYHSMFEDVLHGDPQIAGVAIDCLKAFAARIRAGPKMKISGGQ